MSLKAMPHATLVLSMLLSISVVAYADESKEAETLAREGVELRRIGKDAQALPKFEKAYSISKSAKHLAQMGLCLQAVGRWTEAEEALSGALQDGGNPWIKTNRDIIKDSLETIKQRVGSVEVSGSPKGASVIVDGRLQGQLPLTAPLRLNQGPIVLEVRADGHRSERQELAVQGGQFRRIQVELQPQAPAGVPALSESPPPEEATSSLNAAAAPADEGGGNNTWLWVGAGAALVAAGVVAVLLLSGGASNPNVDGMGKL